MITDGRASYEVSYSEESGDDGDDGNAECCGNVIETSSCSSSCSSLSQIIEDDITLIVKNHPCYLLITEKNDFNFSELIKSSNAPAIKSVIFQVFSAVTIAYAMFSIKNNDLHTGNIMLKKTKKKVLRYKLRSGIYEVPTYGYIAKIIDWGRGTYSIDTHKGNNLIYNDELYSGFYCYDKTGITLDNKYSDVAIFCHSILNDFHNEEITEDWEGIQVFLHKFCKGIDIKEYSWQTYEDIIKMPKKITFEDMFIKHRFFDEYLSSGHNAQDRIYLLPY
jgi:hypothetical protein